MNVCSIVDKWRDNIYSLNESEAYVYLEQLSKEKKAVYLQLIVNDALKILTIKNKKSSLRFNSTKVLYEFLKDADLDEVEFYMEDNIEWFDTLYNQARTFYLMPVIDRCLIMRSLIEDIRKKPLVKLDFIFLFDGMVYTLRKELEDINSYYNDYTNKLGVDFLGNFYLMIWSLLEELKVEDYQKFDQNWMEIIRKFYISYKYTEKNSPVFIPNGAITKQLLEKEELQTAKDIIYALPELFSEVLSFYFSCMNDDQLFDKNELENFSRQHISLEMKKKLTIL